MGIRRSISSVALIRREQKDGLFSWLAQWNAKWKRYNLIAGHLELGESFRDCIMREVHEELGLEEGKEFSVAQEPCARVEFEDWSESADKQTAYTMELFPVELIGVSTHRRVKENLLNRWLTQTEILSHQCNDGKPVSPLVEQLLNEARQAPKLPSETTALADAMKESQEPPDSICS